MQFQNKPMKQTEFNFNQKKFRLSLRTADSHHDQLPRQNLSSSTVKPGLYMTSGSTRVKESDATSGRTRVKESDATLVTLGDGRVQRSANLSSSTVKPGLCIASGRTRVQESDAISGEGRVQAPDVRPADVVDPSADVAHGDARTFSSVIHTTNQMLNERHTSSISRDSSVRHASHTRRHGSQIKRPFPVIYIPTGREPTRSTRDRKSPRYDVIRKLNGERTDRSYTAKQHRMQYFAIDVNNDSVSLPNIPITKQSAKHRSNSVFDTLHAETKRTAATVANEQLFACQSGTVCNTTPQNMTGLKVRITTQNEKEIADSARVKKSSTERSGEDLPHLERSPVQIPPTDRSLQGIGSLSRKRVAWKYDVNERVHRSTRAHNNVRTEQLDVRLSPVNPRKIQGYSPWHNTPLWTPDGPKSRVDYNYMCPMDTQCINHVYSYNVNRSHGVAPLHHGVHSTVAPPCVCQFGGFESPPPVPPCSRDNTTVRI